MNTLTGGQVVHSVNILLGVGLIGVAWVIYKILILDNEEKNSSDSYPHPSDDE